MLPTREAGRRKEESEGWEEEREGRVIMSSHLESMSDLVLQNILRPFVKKNQNKLVMPKFLNVPLGIDLKKQWWIF